MSYQVQVVSDAIQKIENLDSSVQHQLMMKLEELALNPLPEGVKKLEDEKHLYLFHLNEYRVVYQIQEEASLITIIKVAHPKNY
ncbi:MAG: type II toxin-antitoxin system RelE/ParE family toxin [Calothrix sp. MO_167.B12]|nr:type II toxin-antitoxin system RelE/ParE family toxin [Calothrix sp. MO_167.B12]